MKQTTFKRAFQGFADYQKSQAFRTNNLKRANALKGLPPSPKKKGALVYKFQNRVKTAEEWAIYLNMTVQSFRQRLKRHHANPGEYPAWKVFARSVRGSAGMAMSGVNPALVVPLRIPLHELLPASKASTKKTPS